MKAIETFYNNLRFRSRIEARWAYVFDLLGVKYEYEKEGYELFSGKYLPDFWMPELEQWVEIKGCKPNETEVMLAKQLADATNFPVIILSNGIPVSDDYYSHDEIYYPCQGWDDGYKLCECPDCGSIGFEFDGRSDRLQCKDATCPTHAFNGDKTYTGDASRILEAYSLARQARFEYGETPRAWKLPFIAPPLTLTTHEREAILAIRSAAIKKLQSKKPSVVDLDSVPF